jgi:HK97 family phage portal protein
LAFFQRAAPERRSDSPLGDTAWLNPIENLITDQGNYGPYRGIWALRNSDIFTAVRSIAGDIASCPVNVLRDNVIDPKNNLSYLINQRPNQYYSGYALKFIIVANMLLNKESFVEVVSDKNGQPVALYFLKNSSTSVLQHGAQLIYHTYNELTGELLELPASSVWHFKMMTVDGINGVGPLWALAMELATQDGSKNFVKNFFDQGAALGGILKMNSARLDEKQLEAKGTQFSKAYAGAVNSGKIAAIDSTMDFTQLQINSDILNFLNANTFTTKQVAKAFGLPLSRMGLETTNTSTDQENLWYLQNTLGPYLNAMAGEMSFKSAPAATSIQFNTDSIRDIDPDKKLNRIVKMVQNSMETPNQGRREFGMAPDPDPAADQLIASLNYTTLSTLSELQLMKAKSKGGGSNGQEGQEGSQSSTNGNQAP